MILQKKKQRPNPVKLEIVKLLKKPMKKLQLAKKSLAKTQAHVPKDYSTIRTNITLAHLPKDYPSIHNQGLL